MSLTHRIRPPRRRSPGYTLVELVAVVAVAGVVALVPASVLSDSMAVYARTAPRLDACYQAELAVERLKRDFRDLATYASITTMTSSALTFDDSSGTIAYALSGDELTRNGDLLARDVSALTLSYLDAGGASTSTAADVALLDIDLEVSVAGQAHRARACVAPRQATAGTGAGSNTHIDASASAATAEDHDDDHLHIDLVSISASDVEIESFSLSASPSITDLKEFKLDGTKIWKQGSGHAVPTGTVDCNVGSSSDRTIEAGDDPESKLYFKTDPSSGTYELTLVLDFTDGSSDTITFSVTW